MRMIKLIILILLCGYLLTAFAAVKFEINGVNQEAQDNITPFLLQLTPPENADNSMYLKQVEDSTRDALYALGYYQTEIQPLVSGKVGQQNVTLNINPGLQTHINKINLQILGEAKEDIEFIKLINHFPLKNGDVLNHGQYEKAKDRLTSLAQQRGYFDAKFSKASVEVKSKNNSADVFLWFDSGVRYQFGELVFNSQLSSEKYIRSLKSFSPGDPFNYQQLRSFNVDINQTGYFKNITLIPVYKEKQGLQIPLHVVAYMQPKNTFNVGGGYSTDEGINGKLSWSRPWLTQQGHSIDADISASAYEQEYSFTYKIPIAEPLYDYASIQAGYKVVDQNDTDTQQYLVTFSRHRRSTSKWLYNMFVEYDYETGTQGDDFYTTQLILPGISVKKTNSTGGMNATWGDTRLASLKVSDDIWLSDTDLIKAYGKFKIIRTYGKHQFVAYTELGAILVDSIDDVPSSMRFFTGGDQTIRGYSYESIAPTDDNGDLEGGRYLAVGSLEYRYSIMSKWKIALFGDMGTATNDFSETISSSTGLGVVWGSPIGPIRLYLAKPLTNSSDSFALHFMLGPEL